MRGIPSVPPAMRPAARWEIIESLGEAQAGCNHSSSCAWFNEHGSAWDPVILPVFKTGARHPRGVAGVFDSHTLPPQAQNLEFRS